MKAEWVSEWVSDVCVAVLKSEFYVIYSDVYLPQIRSQVLKKQ